MKGEMCLKKKTLREPARHENVKRQTLCRWIKKTMRKGQTEHKERAQERRPELVHQHHPQAFPLSFII